MKHFTIIFFLFLQTGINARQLVNSVIGDSGWECVYGTEMQVTEREKISAHLFYVEELLRANSPAGLDETQRKNRAQLLDALRDYRQRENFPANEDFTGQRRPHFIDSKGNICAVGYLVEQSAGREAAERINAKYSYDRIADMHDAALDAWMQANGLTREECAMIQPEYYFASGPTLENMPADSLLPLVERQIKYDGKADSAFISFTIAENGKFTGEKVDSGNVILGNAVLAVMRKLKYKAAWSNHMGDDPNYRESRISMTFYYGILAASPLNSTIRYLDSGKDIPAPGEGTRFTGQVKDETGEPISFAYVFVYNDSGQVLAATSADIDGRYKLVIDPRNTKNVRLEFKYMGYYTVVVPGIPVRNCEVNVTMSMSGHNACGSLDCLKRIYLAAPAK
jgi:hypothetical protein